MIVVMFVGCAFNSTKLLLLYPKFGVIAKNN